MTSYWLQTNHRPLYIQSCSTNRTNLCHLVVCIIRRNVQLTLRKGKSRNKRCVVIKKVIHVTATVRYVHEKFRTKTYEKNTTVGKHTLVSIIIKVLYKHCSSLQWQMQLISKML